MQQFNNYYFNKLMINFWKTYILFIIFATRNAQKKYNYKYKYKKYKIYFLYLYKNIKKIYVSCIDY